AALPELRAVALSGSPLPAGLAVDALQRLGPVVYNLYGATEAGWITVAGPEDLAAAPGTAGRAVPGVALRIVDESGEDVAPGAVGRIAVESDLVLGEYTDGSAPASQSGLLLLGDLGRIDGSGLLHVIGRADDMVVSGGENVYPSEVEELLSSHPGIAEVAVVGVADEEFGQRLRAVVVPRAGSSLTADEIRDHVRATLARHKVPRDVVFVDALPRNPAGKVLRKELEESC
ncbi:MAG TPA: AMP-binding protein, partial [Mycobacteriales bacterium]|nr:AMP-binding protein [Mycobacteriales bacterium]